MITDHLGSTRLTFSTDAAPMQSQLHNAFGEVTSDVGDGARTGYIGREHDVESDLGFYGVRLYEPEYGRFMSTDPLWGEYITLQPYHYCRNQPLFRTDRGGMGDFFDEEGNFVKSDGVNDGMKFMAEKSVYESADPKENLREQPGMFLLPTKNEMSEISDNVVRWSIGPNYNREYGGVIGESGKFYETPSGPRIDGANSSAEIDINPALSKLANSNDKLKMIVHSHPNLEVGGKGSSLFFTSSPSGRDKQAAFELKTVVLTIFPFTNKMNARFTFFSGVKQGAELKTTKTAIEKAIKHETKE
ncbi:MAG TPA: RHS repeat-associated core domain-containing protein [Chlorobiota bacterium]|nr:RHS repeat-associated core domain-containing protein [Chlorobiota bacterium]